MRFTHKNYKISNKLNHLIEIQKIKIKQMIWKIIVITWKMKEEF